MIVDCNRLDLSCGGLQIRAVVIVEWNCSLVAAGTGIILVVLAPGCCRIWLFGSPDWGCCTGIILVVVGSRLVPNLVVWFFRFGLLYWNYFGCSW